MIVPAVIEEMMIERDGVLLVLGYDRETQEHCASIVDNGAETFTATGENHDQAVERLAAKL